MFIENYWTTNAINPWSLFGFWSLYFPQVLTYTVILGPCRPSEEGSPNVRRPSIQWPSSGIQIGGGRGQPARGKTRRHTRPDLAESEVRFGWNRNEGESVGFQVVMGGSPARDQRKLGGAERWGRWEQIPCPSHLGRVSQFIPRNWRDILLARSGLWDRLRPLTCGLSLDVGALENERENHEKTIGFNMCSLVYSAAVPTAWWRR